MSLCVQVESKQVSVERGEPQLFKSQIYSEFLSLFIVLCAEAAPVIIYSPSTGCTSREGAMAPVEGWELLITGFTGEQIPQRQPNRLHRRHKLFPPAEKHRQALRRGCLMLGSQRLDRGKGKGKISLGL